MKGSLEAKGVYHDLSDQPMAVRAANLTDIPLPDRTLYIYIYISWLMLLSVFNPPLTVSDRNLF